MSAATISPRSYGLILFILLVLTALTTAVSFFDLRGGWHVGAGLVIAVAKASLVILFFMHVIHSSIATRAVIVVTLFWLVGVLLTLTLADYTSRGATPFAPGH